MSTPYTRLQSFSSIKGKSVRCSEKTLVQQLGASCVHECFEAMRLHMPDNTALAAASKSDKGYANAAVRAKAIKEVFAQEPAEVARVHELLQLDANREGLRLSQENQQLAQRNQELCQRCTQVEQQSAQKDEIINKQKKDITVKDRAFSCLLWENQELRAALNSQDALNGLTHISGVEGPEN